MQFCKKCGNLMMPKKKGGKAILVCGKCGAVISANIKPKDFKIGMSSNKREEEIIVVEKKQDSKMVTYPKTAQQCPKCENDEAFWWMQQTRAADEAPTRFYKCTKCGHTWREYE